MRFCYLFAFQSVRFSCAALISAVALSGCNSGQIGGDINLGSDGEGTAGGCEDASTKTVGVDDAISGAGFVLGDLIAAIEGTHSAEMKWGATGFSKYAQVSPAASETSITLDIDVLSNTGRWVTRQEKSSSSGEGVAIDIASPICANELRVDASVTVTAENGAFRDTFPATFVTRDGTVASSRLEVMPGELMGSFDVEVTGLENGKASQTGLDLSFAFGAVSGKLAGIVESNDGQVAMAGGIEYAYFPIANDCQGGVQVPETAAIVTELKNVLDAHTTFNFSWQGETPIEMDVTPTLGAVCFESSDYSTESSFVAKLSLKVTSSDDSISGTWPLTVDANIEAGKLARIAVFRDAYLGDTFSTEEFEEKTGITGIDSSADSLSYSFGYNIDLTSEQAATGELTILELMIPDCAKQGYVAPVETSPDGGMGSPGCSGVDAQESKNATLIER